MNVYAPTNPRERKGFFESLHEYFFPDSIKVIRGDFNSIESELDKFGGNFMASMELKEFRVHNQLIDDWRNKQGRVRDCTWFNASKTIGNRLDKFFISRNLLHHVQDCEIQPWVFSNHDCVNLHLNLKDVFSHGPGIWHFNVSLLVVDVFCSLISDITTRHVALKTAFPSIHEWWVTLKDLFKVASKTFSKKQQRKMNSQLVNLTNQLIQAKRSLIAGDTSASILIEQLESEIQHLQLGNQGAAKVRSRAQWIESGEKPTRFFFSLEAATAQKNSTSTLHDSDGTEVSEQENIERIHVEFYKNLYSNTAVDENIDMKIFLSKVQATLNVNEVTSCDQQLLLQEITTAMKGLAGGKTPGSDGFPVEFYAKFRTLLGPHLVEVYNYSLEKGYFSESMQRSVTRLLYKKGDIKDLKNWCPISLLNCDYKIASKTLANRLAKVLPSIIQEDQTCSVPGRTIFENLTLLRDILDYVNKTNETGILLNLDQEKAFDRVDRNFLLNTLKHFGFGLAFQR